MALNDQQTHILEQSIEPFLGVDLDMSPASARTRDLSAGDLKLTPTHDVKTIKGVELVVQSRIRELTTPYGYYARYVEDYEGVKVLDANYGNKAFSYLSEPMNTLPLDKIIEACAEVMLKDARISSAEVIPDLDIENGLILIRINFTVIDGNTGDLQFALNQLRNN